jgi:hypothetical protein
MLELISIVASIAVLILTPIEVGKIQRGWVRKNFKGTPAEFLVAYKRQLTLFVWLGIVLGILDIGLGIVEETPYENYVKYFAALLWFGVSGVSYYCRNKLAAAPPPAA